MKIIRKILELNAPPEEVYQLLMDSKLHGEFTQSTAVIGKREGDSFQAYDGYIHGKNIKLVMGKRIVQSWIAEEDKWPKGHSSTVTFEFEKTATGTSMTFVHSGIPDELYENLKEGWEEYYFTPMKNFLKKK